MAAPNNDGLRIWVLAGLGAVGLMFAILALVRVPRPAGGPRVPAAGTIPAASLGLTLNSGKRTETFDELAILHFLGDCRMGKLVEIPGVEPMREVAA